MEVLGGVLRTETKPRLSDESESGTIRIGCGREARCGWEG
jgi:hypothetical protein